MPATVNLPQSIVPDGDSLIPNKMLICVTFFYVEKRLRYLDTISAYFSQLAETVSVYVITNSDDPVSKKKIEEVIRGKGFDFEVVSPTLLPHRFLLGWCHLEIFRTHFKDETISHFLCIEDDICIKPNNIVYWTRGREALRVFNLIPSFLRYEIKDGGDEFYSSDVTEKVNIFSMPKINISEAYVYLNLPQPYQGMYLLDRDLMHEHLTGLSSYPDFGKWPIREKATQGVTFLNVPKGFWSRNLVGYKSLEKGIDPDCLIQHLPNNYANNPDSPHGKILISSMISPWEPFIPAGMRGCLKDLLPPLLIRWIRAIKHAVLSP